MYKVNMSGNGAKNLKRKKNCCITNNEDDKQYLIIMSKFYLESIIHYGTRYGTIVLGGCIQLINHSNINCITAIIIYSVIL